MRPGALILMYHRVADLPSDLFAQAVSPEFFAEHLAVMRQRARPLALRQLVNALRDGRVPPRAVVVTLDDGYADNLHEARPLLERHDVPATVCVTTSYVGARREFWWDDIERLVLLPRRLPEILRIEIGGAVHEWELGEAALLCEDAATANRGWTAWERPRSRRQAVFRKVWDVLVALGEEDRQTALEQMRAWSGSGEDARPTHRTLTVGELRRLVDGGLVEAGAHGVTHSKLSLLPTYAQRDEIEGSKATLEEMLGQHVGCFAYPHGDYTPEVLDMVRRAQFTEALAVRPACIRGRRTDLYQLPRVWPQNWDGERFSRELEGWFRTADRG